MMDFKKMSFMRLFHGLTLMVVLTYLFVPLSATFLYSITTNWSTSSLSKNYTLQWFVTLFQDRQFYAAMWRTALLALIGTVGSTLLIVPTVFLIYVYHKSWLWIMDVLQIIAFSVPAIISAMALMSAYSGNGIPMLALVIGSYVVGGISIIQLGMRNALHAIDARVLMESSEILGASKLRGFLSIILPNVKNEIIASALFRYSILFGEFGTLNLLVGGYFPNIQIFLRQNMRESGHYTAAISISYFAIVTVMTIISLKLTSNFTRRKTI